ncbi:hypothetical protein WJX73_006841 [Symbiochloris irregularis]|uniref:Rab-GAP TBC domain-containing protein n=1 Tax=Symbiochloris irregularis TaxID=706552 RepID=A0AAW1NVP4_9CHLO
MASEPKAGGLNGVKNFLRGRKFPGTVRLSHRGRDGSLTAEQDAAHVLSPNSSDAKDASKLAPAGSPAVSQEASFSSTEGGPVLWQGAASQPAEQPVAATARDPAGNEMKEGRELRSASNTRRAKFNKLLAEQVVDLDALRELCWSGIPSDLRPMCWRLLVGYLPPNRERRDAILARKRAEYRDMVPQWYDIAGSSDDDAGALRQVRVDAPRTAPGVACFHQPAMQKSLERILYLWGCRHPASGYVQGINDLVTPFLAVFLSAHLQGPLEDWQVDSLSEEDMLSVEADSYFCLSKLLDGIQDHYTYAQPGIQRTVFSMKELVRCIEEPLSRHLETQGLEFLQFAFRWVNCLLIREIPFQAGFRLWDTYLAEGPKMREFLVFVLASFLLQWSRNLAHMDFQELVMFLQKPPTGEWGEGEVEFILSRAYMWRITYGDAPSHWKQT